MRLRSDDDLDAFLTYIVDASIRRTRSERGMLIVEEAGGELVVRIARIRGGMNLPGEPRFPTSVVQRVLETGEPVNEKLDQDRGKWGSSVLHLELHLRGMRGGLRFNDDGRIVNVDLEGETSALLGAGVIFPLADQVTIVGEVDYESGRFDGRDDDLTLLLVEFGPA